jgi:hypothetical protein
LSFALPIETIRYHPPHPALSPSAYKGRFFTGSHACAPPSPWQGEGWGEGSSRRRLFPLTQTLSPSGGEGDQGGCPCPVAQKPTPESLTGEDAGGREGTEIPDDQAVRSRSVRCRFLYWNLSPWPAFTLTTTWIQIIRQRGVWMVDFSSRLAYDTSVVAPEIADNRHWATLPKNRTNIA